VEPWRRQLHHDHDKLRDALLKAKIAACPSMITLLDGTIDALKVQMRERRERPGVRQCSREAEFFFRLWCWYEARLRDDARLGRGGPFYKFAQACGDLAEITVLAPDPLRSQIKRALKES
jgi:hypothetical protein